MFRLKEIFAYLRAIHEGIKIMALNLANLQAAVSALSADVNTLIGLVDPATAAANQNTIDAVTASLTQLDTAVKTAEAPPVATGPVGTASGSGTVAAASGTTGASTGATGA